MLAGRIRSVAQEARVRTVSARLNAPEVGDFGMQRNFSKAPIVVARANVKHGGDVYEAERRRQTGRFLIRRKF